MALAAALGGAVLGAISSHFQSSAQQSYNQALNKQSYQYARKLNEQMRDIGYQRDQYSATLSDWLMQRQLGYERNARQTAYVDTRKDLETAGYNPLLALGNQSQGLSVGITAPQSGGGSASFNAADSSFVLDSMNSAVSNYNNTRSIDSAIKSSEYTNDVNLAQAEFIRSQTRGQDINNVIEDRYGLKRAIAEINNLKTQGVLNKSQANYYTKQLAVADSQIAVNSAEAQVLRSQHVLNQQQYDINAPTQRFAKSHPVAHGTLQRVNPVSALGSLAGVKYLFSGKSGGGININNYR